MTDSEVEARTVRDQIVRTLAHLGPCPDGPECRWCPAERIVAEFDRLGWFVVQRPGEA